MVLSKAQADRLNRGVDLLFKNLNSTVGAGYSQQDLPYRPCKMEDRRIAFGVSHRAPVGGRHPNGQKWITHKGPSIEDCELIAQTAHTPEEIANQFHRCVFEGIRPMRMKGGQLVDEAAINAIVNERLRVLLDEKIAELMRKQNPAPPASIEAAAAAAPPEEPKLWEPDNIDSMRLIDIWSKRADELGLTPPKLAKGGRIDGRWMRNAQDKWRAHLAAKTPEGATPA